MKPLKITIAVLMVLALIFTVVLCVLTRRPARGRRQAEFVNQPTYQIKIHDDFLTAEECAQLRTLATPHMTASAVYTSDADVLDSKTRISEQAWLTSHHAIVNIVRARVRAIIPYLSPAAHLEDIQVVKYEPGGFFTPHYDACVGSAKFCRRMDHPHGPRYITVLIYLSDKESDNLEGGDTVFPRIEQRVTPKMGRMVLFYNIDERDESIIEQALHGGEPVTAGEKWIANQWIRIW